MQLGRKTRPFDVHVPVFRLGVDLGVLIGLPFHPARNARFTASGSCAITLSSTRAAPSG
jgi:hypothetical protein